MSRIAISVSALAPLALFAVATAACGGGADASSRDPSTAENAKSAQASLPTCTPAAPAPGPAPAQASGAGAAGNSATWTSIAGSPAPYPVTYPNSYAAAPPQPKSASDNSAKTDDAPQVPLVTTIKPLKDQVGGASGIKVLITDKYGGEKTHTIQQKSAVDGVLAALGPDQTPQGDYPECTPQVVVVFDKGGKSLGQLAALCTDPKLATRARFDGIDGKNAGLNVADPNALRTALRKAGVPGI